MFQKLDKAQLPHLGAVWPVIAKHLAAYDPGNQYAVNYMWGTVGIGYNVKMARAILGGTGAIDSWNTIFAPGELAKFKGCGVHMLDSSDDVLPAVCTFWAGIRIRPIRATSKRRRTSWPRCGPRSASSTHRNF